MKSSDKFVCGESKVSDTIACTGRRACKEYWVRLLTTVFILCFLALSTLSCCRQPGETAAESRRRHKRILRVNTQEMMADIDKALLLDKPSKLTEKRIP